MTACGAPELDWRAPFCWNTTDCVVQTHRCLSTIDTLEEPPGNITTSLRIRQDCGIWFDYDSPLEVPENWIMGDLELAPGSTLLSVVPRST